jgi:isoquinoline 1-oxidoreductase beta subunit
MIYGPMHPPVVRPGTEADRARHRTEADRARPGTEADRAPPGGEANRREFVKALGGGLVVGAFLPAFVPRAVAASASAEGASAIAGAPAAQFAPNAFVRIGTDDTVTVVVKHIEFGQGPFTGLSTLVAEELDADWSQMRAEAAPADVEKYANTLFGMQGTGGSTAMANSYEQMRRAGATARAMLVAAAAEQWGVAADEITVEAGVVRHPGSGRSARFGELAERAAGMPVPTDVPLKDPAEFRLIGTDVPKLDTAAKTDGGAMYSIDVYRDGMLTAVVARPPRFGALVQSVDDAAARRLPGVVDVQTIPQGVAVYARDTWTALKARESLEITWDESNAERRSSRELFDLFAAATERSGLSAASVGDAAGAAAGAVTTVDAVYQFPFLAHAPMETLDAVAVRTAEGVEVWMGSQVQTLDQQAFAEVLGVPMPQVRIHTMFAGGSFGRRAQQTSAFAREMAEVLARVDPGTPVKLIWSREDDIRGGWYRPLTVHRLRGGLDAGGNIVAWSQTVAAQSILAGSAFEQMMQGGVDPSSVEGAADLPYAIPNLAVSVHNMQTGVPVLWWRSVGHTHTAYVVETFLDELLAVAGRDAVEGRLALLQDAPRHSGVLRAVAERAGWRDPVPEGRARGVAVHKSFESYVAQIAEVSRGDDGLPRVHQVWCAVDCGVPVNPNVITAQMESGIGFGLGAILYDEITIEEGGTVRERNFDRYKSIRIDAMPAVDVHIMRSTEPPTGVGEPGVPPIGPAVANAWRRLTGESVRRLPFAVSVGTRGGAA